MSSRNFRTDVCTISHSSHPPFFLFFFYAKQVTRLATNRRPDTLIIVLQQEIPFGRPWTLTSVADRHTSRGVEPWKWKSVMHFPHDKLQTDYFPYMSTDMLYSSPANRTEFQTFLVLFSLRHCKNLDRPPLWSSSQSSWLQIRRSRVRFPAIPDFLRSSGSGKGVHSASWG
jgi:hypothetical protein